jgi:hypothetical protein
MIARRTAEFAFLFFYGTTATAGRDWGRARE